MDVPSNLRIPFSRNFFDDGYAEWGENGKSASEIIQLVKDYNKVPGVNKFEVPNHNQARWCCDIIHNRKAPLCSCK
jgi:hypothetical protein